MAQRKEALLPQLLYLMGLRNKMHVRLGGGAERGLLPLLLCQGRRRRPVLGAAYDVCGEIVSLPAGAAWDLRRRGEKAASRYAPVSEPPEARLPAGC